MHPRNTISGSSIGAKNSRKGLWIKAVCLATIAVVCYTVHYLHVSNEVNKALKPCWTVMGQQFHSPMQTIPCYQNALKVDPGNNWLKMRLADEMTRAGNFGEARSLYQNVANVIGLYQAEAKWDLMPGHLQAKARDETEDVLAARNLQMLIAKDNAEEANFLKQHAQVFNGEIQSMSGVDKQYWLQMRRQHMKDEEALRSHPQSGSGPSS